MKFALVSAFLCATVMAGVSGGNFVNSDYLSKVVKAKDKCQNQFKIDDSVVEDFILRFKKPHTAAGKCYVACYMEERGLMKNGKTVKDAIIADNENKWKDVAHQKLGKQVIEKCENEVSSDTDDKCALAVDYVMCLVKKSDEAGLPKLDVAHRHG